MLFQICMTFVFLMNVCNQTGLVAIDFHFMKKKPLRHFSKYLTTWVNDDRIILDELFQKERGCPIFLLQNRRKERLPIKSFSCDFIRIKVDLSHKWLLPFKYVLLPSLSLAELVNISVKKGLSRWAKSITSFTPHSSSCLHLPHQQ